VTPPLLEDGAIARAVQQHRIDLDHRLARLGDVTAIRCTGSVVQVIGLTIEAEGVTGRLGEMCEVYPYNSSTPIAAEVVGFRNNRVLLIGDRSSRRAATRPPPTLRTRCRAAGSPMCCRPACARSTGCSPSGADSAWASSPARASASRRCSA
jgi:hypothetical protein